MGDEGAFREGSYEASGTWIAVTFVLGLIAAVLNGFVCARIAPRPRPLYALIGLVVVLGLIGAVGTMFAEDPGPRGDDVDNLEAMMNAVTPIWVAFVNPVIGVIGVLLGGRRATRGQPG